MLKIKFDTRQFNKDLVDFQEKVEKSFDEELKKAAENTASDTNILDSDIPVIAGSTSVTKIDNGYEINKGGSLAHPELAAYSEFGTGDYAKALLVAYPEEWKKMAWRFFKTGKGRLPASPALYPSFNRNMTNIADKVANKIGK